MAKIIETESNVLNQISAGTNINGDITTNGDIRFDGGLVGNLNTKGKVVVGETGSVKGEVNCKNSVIEGNIEGKIVVSELLTLKSTSSLNGDIITRRLAIEPGAKFTGNCNMGAENLSGNGTKGPDKQKENVK